MKSTLNLDLEKEDIQEILHDVIKEYVIEILSDNLPDIIRKKADKLVNNEIDKILHPIVLKTLTDADFDFKTGYHSYKNKHTIDTRIRAMTKDYLNKPSFLYSKTETNPSKRYNSSGCSSEPSLIEHIVTDKIKEFVDMHFTKVIEEKVSIFKNDKEKLKKIIDEKTAEMLKSYI